MHTKCAQYWQAPCGLCETGWPDIHAQLFFFFFFEDVCGQLGKMVTGPRNPMQQVCDIFFILVPSYICYRNL